MQTNIFEFQKNIFDKKIKVSDLLDKSLVVSLNLKDKTFHGWTEKELNGYGDCKVPEYRIIEGEVKGWNPYSKGWIPLIIEDPKNSLAANKRAVGQSIAELEALVESSEDDASFNLPLSNEIQRKLSEGFTYDTKISFLVSRAKLVKIIETVKHNILNWAMKLTE